MFRFLLLSTLLVWWPVQGAAAADAAHGNDLAQRWCSSCHAIGRAPQVTTDIPPSFFAIAQRPDFDVNRLVRFLLDPHPKMPKMDFSRIEVTDLAAYIASLRN